MASNLGLVKGGFELQGEHEGGVCLPPPGVWLGWYLRETS